MNKYIPSFFLILCLGLWSGNLAYAQPTILTFDNIPKEDIGKFDRTQAIPGKSFSITSIQNNAVIPNNYLYPLIEWQEPEDDEDAFLVELKSNNHTLHILLKKNVWQPDSNEFKEFLKEQEVWITLYWLEKGKTYKSQSVRLVISKRPLNEQVAFRTVQPLFVPALNNTIEIFSFDQKRPVRLVEFEGTCVGCHGYAANSAYFNIKKETDRRLVMARQSNHQFQLNQRSFDEFSFFTISPDGKYAALVKNPKGDLTLNKSFIEPFDFPYRSADIYSYDVEKNTLTPLKGASDPNFVEDMPFFSPDGKYLLFSRYHYSEKNGVQGVHSMDLYQVPFNNGNGGEPVPIKNASSNNMHQYFPRYAPNGKWISFCRGDGLRGIYARKSSDIYLLSLDGNTVTKMNLNRDNVMDSWHDWSPDSHWLIFSSNREKTRLTALFLAYIDEAGKDYPPVKLVGYDNMKVNTPQFVQKNLDLESLKNVKNYIDSLYTEPKK